MNSGGELPPNMTVDTGTLIRAAADALVVPEVRPNLGADELGLKTQGPEVSPNGDVIISFKRTGKPATAATPQERETWRTIK